MKLSVLLCLSGISSDLETDPEIEFLTCDSRQVKSGTLFFALKGATVDGHRFIQAAIDAGAVAVVLEHSESTPSKIPSIIVPDARSAMATIAAKFNDDPTANRPLIGITGTNGKTTTTFLLESILTAADMAPAVLGTIAYRFGSIRIEASHTTPESTELQMALSKLAQAGADSFIMEVSSHALEQKRVDGCHFDVGIFSNLTRDHLDYHGDMETYCQAKSRFFSHLLIEDSIKPVRRAVINIDDKYGDHMALAASCPVITYAIEEPADVRPEDYRISVEGISGNIITPLGVIAFSSSLMGRFNLYNILAAAASGIALGIPLSAIKKGIENHTTVPGRMERVANNSGITCLVDYAHTGDALQNVLSTIKEIATSRIITVFGCGGDRDNGKRPIMGKIATQLSDLTIVTSDNPRTENSEKIIEQIVAGIDLSTTRYYHDSLNADFTEKGFIVVSNRHDAIKLAVSLAKPGDILLLAGKGHEDYQIIGKTKHHFDDREEAAKRFALREN